MRKLFGRKKDGSDGVPTGNSATGMPQVPPGGGMPQLPPAAPPPAAAEGGDDLRFLPPGRPAAMMTTSAPAPRRPVPADDALPMPGAGKSRLAGLFDADDDGFGSQPSAFGSSQPSAFAKPPVVSSAAAPPSPRPDTAQAQTQAQVLWSGSSGLFRLDDDGETMVEVDAGENRGSLFGVAVKATPGPGGSIGEIELIIYTAMRKKSRLKASVSALDISAPNGESAAFYDDNGLYWALQLSSVEEAMLLTRILLSAKAMMTGAIAYIETQAAASEDVIIADASVTLRAALALQDVGEAKEVATEPSTETALRPHQADTRWGVGIGDIITAQGVGSSVLIAVPPALQAAAWRSRGASGRCALLLDLEDLQQVGARSRSASAVVQAEALAQGTSPQPSVKERMAKLGISTLPMSPGMAPASPPQALEPAQAPAQAPAPAPALAPALAPMPSLEASSGFGYSAQAWSSMTSPSLGTYERPFDYAPAPAPVVPPYQPPADIGSGRLNVHPAADIMRHYWSAVQDSGSGSPYAFLGALPFVPGLTRQLAAATGPSSMPSQAPFTPAPPVTSSLPMPTVPSAPLEPLPSVTQNAASQPMRTTPLGSVTLGELVEAVRDVVRVEATPEGWQAERQKLERRVALLEEQLNSSKIHQEQVRENHRSQLASLHKQLADAQMMAHQMREQQLRMEGDRQMREWERDAHRGAVETELQQARSELQQLRLEERGLRDRLADAQAAQQRAEGQAAAAAHTAVTASTVEAQLREMMEANSALQAQQREQMEANAALRRELQAFPALRKEDAVAVCKNAIAIAFMGIRTAVPGSGAMVDADAVQACVKGVCQQCCIAVEQEVQKADLGTLAAGRSPTPIGDSLRWENIESIALSSLGPPLADETSRIEALQREASEQGGKAQRFEQEAATLRAELEYEKREAARKLAEANQNLTALTAAHEEEVQRQQEQEQERTRQAEEAARERALEAERLRKEAEEGQQKRDVEDRRQREEEELKRVQDEEQRRRQLEEAEGQQKRDEEDRCQREDEELKRVHDEEQRRKELAEAEGQQKRDEEDRRQREEELKRVHDEEQRRKELEEAEEQQNGIREQEETRLRELEAADEQERLLEAERLRKEAEEERRRQEEQEEEERRRKAEEDEQQRLQEEEAQRLAEAERLRDAEAKRLAEAQEEAQRLAEAEAEQLRREEDERIRQKEAEEEAQRRREEEAEEQRRRQEQEEAEEQQRAAEEERLRKEAEEEQQKREKEKEEEARRYAEEEDQKRAREEAQRLQEEQAQQNEEAKRPAAAGKNLFGDSDDDEKVPAAKASSAATKSASLFDDDDDDDALFGSAKQKTKTGGAAAGRSAAKKPPANLFGDDSDGSFCFPK